MAGMRSRPIAAALILLSALLVGADMGQSMSALKRTILASNPVAYWPLEDESDAAFGGSAAIGGPMRVNGTVEWGAETDLVGTERAPNVSAGALFAPVSGGSSTSWHVEMAVKGEFVNSAFARIYTTSSEVQTWRLFWPQNASAEISLIITDAAGDPVGASPTGAAVGSDWENVWHHIVVTGAQNGGNVAVQIYVDGALYVSGNAAFSVSNGAVAEVWANHQLKSEFTSFAHIAVGDGTTPSGAADAMDGYAGETAATRFARLCTEAGVAYSVAS